MRPLLNLLVVFIEATFCLNFLCEKFQSSTNLNDTEKSRKLYNILLTRKDSYAVLVESLKKNKQSGALSFLPNNEPAPITGRKIKYDEKKILGQGYSGRVFQGKFGGRDVAVKRMHIDLEHTAMQEVELLEKLDVHENIVRFFTAEAEPNYICVALELCSTTLEMVVKHNHYLDASKILIQCTKGVAFLHENNVVHCGLKPSHILLTESGQVKISDFGMAMKIPKGRRSVTVLNGVKEPIGWIAPEFLKHLFDEDASKQKLEIYPAADVFSLGCIFFFTLTRGSHPFGKPVERQYKIYKNRFNLKNDSVCIFWQELIEKMILPDATKRPTSAAVLHLIHGNSEDHWPTCSQRNCAQPVKGKLSERTFEKIRRKSVDKGSIVYLPNSIGTFRRLFFHGSSIARIHEMTISQITGGSASSQPTNEMSNEQSLVCKYSGNALLVGRPLNSVVILMAGASYSGKSSIINSLFDDINLCATSSSSSETKSVTLIKKKLWVTAEDPTVYGHLTIIDVPGTFDTDSRNEAANMASIRKLKTSGMELEDRDKQFSFIPQSVVANFRKKVYPNIVLFVIDLTDILRMDGSGPFLVKPLKTFKKTADFIDSERNNVIVVLTKVMTLPWRKEKFLQRLQNITDVIQKQFLLVLGIRHVEVVPVENDPEVYDLEKIGDFYKLPNGETSHLNLFHAMLRTVDQNNDLLGRLFICWYFGSNCPEKKQIPELVNGNKCLKPDEIAIAAADLEELNILSREKEAGYMFPGHTFRNLGRGYCPVTEEVKPVSPFQSLGERCCEVNIENGKLFVPSGVQAFVNDSRSIHRLSFMEREEYQSHMQHSYGLDDSVKLVVTASSKGRWLNTGSRSQKCSLISLLQEIKLATYQINKPKDKELRAGFLEELNSLPDNYDEKTKDHFGAFFSRWGTHVVVEEGIGGAVQMNCIIQQASLTKQQLQNMEAKVSGIFNAIFGGRTDYDYDSQMGGLREVGVTNEFLKIDGGTPPSFVTLDTATQETLREWSKTISGNPAELKHTMKLFPYFNFFDIGKKYFCLQQATKDFLENRLTVCGSSTSRNAKNLPLRNEIASLEIERVVQSANAAGGGGSNCFPKGAMVTMEDDAQLEIEKLKENQARKLQTIQFSPKSSNKMERNNINFCTFLHQNSDQILEFLVLEFDNGHKLTASSDHLLFEFRNEKKKKIIKEKQMKHFMIGNRAVYMDNIGSDNKKMLVVETPSIVNIRREARQGVYAPLTSSGTLIVDGFLVSSYANTNSFLVADLAMLPLKLWCKINKKKGNSDKSPGSTKCNTGGIHPYAEFLMAVRKNGDKFLHSKFLCWH